MAVFTLEADYSGETGYPFDNSRQIGNCYEKLYCVTFKRDILEGSREFIVCLFKDLVYTFLKRYIL